MWPEALKEALLACERLSTCWFNRAFGAALYQVAELHRLRGELDKAETVYRRAAESGRALYPGLALLRLAQGRHADASAAIAGSFRKDVTVPRAHAYVECRGGNPDRARHACRRGVLVGR